MQQCAAVSVKQRHERFYASSLLAGLLDVLRCNINRKNNDVAIFLKSGRVFAAAAGRKTATEQRRLAAWR